MAERSVCSIDGCGKKHSSRGWCSAHYYRWKTHGDPLGGRRGASPGAPLRWIEDHRDYSGDDCLKWPFEIGRYGYGTVRHEGKKRIASRVMCEAVHGKPKDESLQAAHSCGNGHLGCTNPRHLRWATKSENAEDMKAHGTFAPAQIKKASLFNIDLVRRIRAMSLTMSQTQIAREIGLSVSQIGKIVRRERWAWVD